MRSLTALFSLALPLLSCAVHVRDFLPRTGQYALQIHAPDAGTALVQSLSIVSDGSQAATVYLPDQTGLPPVCAWNAEAADCQRILGGLLLGKLLTARAGVLTSRVDEVLLQEPLENGASFDVYDDGVCKLRKEVRAVARNELTLANTRVCGGSSTSRGIEIWRRGEGMVRMVAEDGTTATVSPKE